jgi:hypothetical protein
MQSGDECGGAGIDSSSVSLLLFATLAREDVPAAPRTNRGVSENRTRLLRRNDAAGFGRLSSPVAEAATIDMPGNRSQTSGATSRCVKTPRLSLLRFWSDPTLYAPEAVVFLANGRRCPLTDLAQKYGDPSGHVGDTLFPERCTRYTFRAFGTLYAIGLILVAVTSLLS